RTAMNPLLSRLAALRRRLRLVTTVRGSCWTLAVLVGALAVACLFDIFTYKFLRLELPGLVRGLLLAATLAGTGYIGYRWLLPLLLFPAEAGTAFVRVLDPFGDNPWVASNPQTFLEVDYPKQVAYGQKFVIRATVKGHLPERRVASFEFGGYVKPSLEVKFEV